MTKQTTELLYSTDLRQIAGTLIVEYYNIVDPRYATYCALNAHVVSQTLCELGLPGRIVPCQAIYINDQNRYVIGFSGHVLPGQWDGHVAVEAGPLLIDCSTGGFRKFFQVEVPSRCAVQRLSLDSTLIAAAEVGGGAHLLWTVPPAGKSSQIPSPPANLVEGYATALAMRVRAKVGLRPLAAGMAA
jgi:hypothetical protein